MQNSQDRAKRSRRWGFACLNCRKKKVRCDGGKPQCGICSKAGEECTYKASDAVNSELAAEVRRREDEIDALRGQIKRLSGLGADERDAALTELTRTLDRESSGDPVTSEESPADTARLSELSIDNGGHVRHYGATSRFYTAPYENKGSEPDRAEQDYHRKWLRSNARFQQSWEATAREKLREPPLCDEIDPVNAEILLDIFWAWQGPMHNWVYRRCFYRDMALGGPYFSTFLLYVIFVHAGRHIRADDPRFVGFDKGESFLLKAKQLLVSELETPRIPTVQGLLMLGGRQSAIGKTSEGWLYTSMAVSMIKDLGLHVRKDAGSLLKNLEPDDLEARKRLYLSAYIWDKSLSLCIGRPPSLPEMPYSRDCLLDDADNHDVWSPVHLEDLSDRYPHPTYGFATDNFMSFVKLAQLITQVYAAVYGNQSALSPTIVYSLEKKLRNYYSSLPQHLRVNDIAQTAVSPPPHIATVSILYHTVLILLFRPFYQAAQETPAYRELSRRAHVVCNEEAEAVNAHFRAYGRTFNFRNQTHLLSYCVYTAATVDVQAMQSSDSTEAHAATERLEITLRMLDTEAEQTPGVRRSVDIIRCQLAQIVKRDDDTQTLPQPDESSAASNAAAQAVTAPPGFNNIPVGAPAFSRSLGFSAAEPLESFPLDYGQPVQAPYGQPFTPSSDPSLTGMSFDGLGDMSWFNWEQLDISGGFGPYGYNYW